jgi:hypothetical protein
MSSNNLSKQISVFSTRGFSSGCWMPVAWAAEDALAAAFGVRVYAPDLKRRRYLFRDNRIARNLARAWPSLPKRVFGPLGSPVFLFLMGLREDLMPLLQDADRRKSIYLFDTWEPEWSGIERQLATARNLQTVYMSSSQAVDFFKDRLDCEVCWLPQAATSNEFHHSARDWTLKTNTILNIGRSNRVLDQFFEHFAAKHGWEYIKPEIRGGVRFESRNEFLQTLYRSKIVVVHPRNLEYPEATGCVSMLTARYFEAYQSAGVVCGFKPNSGEFEQVLGDFPFVEFGDPQQFEEELLAATHDAAPWLAAEQQCKVAHTWEQRVLDIAARLS